MSDIFRRSKHKQEHAAGEAAPVIGYDKPTGGASKDLGAAKGGPSSSFVDPYEKELQERREREAREKAERERIAREKAKR
jgi:hypothetical protein